MPSFARRAEQPEELWSEAESWDESLPTCLA